MLKVQVLDNNGKKVSEVKAPEDIFSFPVKEHLLYEAVVNYRAPHDAGLFLVMTTTSGLAGYGGAASGLPQTPAHVFLPYVKISPTN